MEPRDGGRGWGLTLFLRRGLIAWMRAWPQAPPTEPRRERDRVEEPEKRLRFSADLRDELVSVWVSMVLQLHKEVLI